MIASCFRWVALLLLAGGLGSAAPPSDSSRTKGLEPDRLGAICEYGIALALRGELAPAETAFVSLLSAAPRDPRALMNLGNVHLLRGDVRDALGFFGRAQRSDARDPGILLNRAVAFLLLGEDEPALHAARAAIAMAGGLDSAASLLGIRLAERPSDSVKTSEPVYLSKNEIRDLLETAAAATPVESLSAPPPASLPPPTAKKGRKRVWRSAGARGAEGRSVAALIYWKR